METINKSAKKVIDTLISSGFETYCVGGCVRDLLMGKPPHDWDICTSALPQQVIDVFGEHNCIPTGLQHGTVSVRQDDELFEVTTFRTEGTYSDNRHPDAVSFVTDLKEDSSRRDFTINAMAYNDDTGIMDYFGGKTDLEQGIIRCVGVPTKRFQEDALRVMRCFRFAATFGFTIEEHTLGSAKACAVQLKNIAPERIQAELRKLLVSDTPSRYLPIELLTVIIPELIPCIGFAQHNPHHEFDVYEHILSCVDNSEPILEVRMAMLLHDIAKPQCFSLVDGIGHFYTHAQHSETIALAILKRLRFSRDEIETITMLVKHHDFIIAADATARKKQAKRMLAKHGLRNATLLIAVKKADRLGQGRDAPNAHLAMQEIQLGESLLQDMIAVINDKEPISVKDLSVDGSTLMCELHLPQGKMIGVILDELLSLVMDGTIENEENILLDTAKSLFATQE